MIALKPHILLHKNSVGAARHRGAGKNSNGFGGSKPNARRRSCSKTPRKTQPGIAIPVQIRVAYGVAVNC